MSLQYNETPSLYDQIVFAEPTLLINGFAETDYQVVLIYVKKKERAENAI